MYHIVQALVRWIAPVLSFTADELWQHIPGHTDERDSVFLHTWYQGLFGLDDGDILTSDQWQSLSQVRVVVAKALEKLRVGGTIGSSLDAEVTLYCDGALYDTLAVLEDELRFVLITSYATLKPLADKTSSAVAANCEGSTLWLEAVASEHQKCIRCWHHRTDVGEHSAHPELCGRCVDNVDGDGERRRFA